MKTFDNNQLTAINAKDGYYMVLAPPGCGKTDILAERIAVARENGTDFADMLCLTYTNRASRGMRQRITERIGLESSELFVGNIHRLCSKYIFSNKLVAENTSIIDEEDMADLFCSYDLKFFRLRNGLGNLNKAAVKYVSDLSSYIRQCRLEHPESVRFAQDGFTKWFSLAKRYDFNFELLPSEYLALKYALMYNEYKEARGIMDFADILIYAYDHLVKDDSHHRYPWIQVDEVQDLNGLQLAIIDQLTAPNGTVMYLGDEQQAIFSFMGAKLSLLSLLKKRCAGNLLYLGNNYRAPQYLLDVCNDFAKAELKVDPELLPNSLDKTSKERLDLILTESMNIDDEHGRILNMVKYYLGLDSNGRLAILVTKNDEADKISETLTRNGISNFKISGVDMFKSKSYKTLVSIYSVLVNDFNFIAWARLIHGIKAVNTLVEARNLVSKLKPLMMTPSDLILGKTYLQKFIETYQSKEFVFFDTETTGLDVLHNDIVQIAAFKVRNGEKVPGSDFNILLHTDLEIPTKLGEKDNPLVKEYAENSHYRREEGLKMFIEYIGDCPLLGHNVTYDYLILQNNVERTLGIKVVYDIFDSLHIIKCVEPGLRMYKLEYLLNELSLPGKNSHLADEDISATKELVDYCVKKILPILARQEEFLNGSKVKGIRKRMATLGPLLDSVRKYMYSPISITHHTLAEELGKMYQRLISLNIIEDLGPKFDIFLKYVSVEWTYADVDDSLYGQICTHIYDITSTINEGDLVNSGELLCDRVFIMTVYKGKGLEFDNVVVLGAIDGAYPFFAVNKILSNPNSSEKDRNQAKVDRLEDARKFYVAISRARKRLCISYSKFNAQGYFSGITPFIHSIKNHFFFFTDPKNRKT